MSPGRLKASAACALLLGILVGCGADNSRLAVCMRGDTSSLIDDLAGGTFEIDYRDQSGASISVRTAPADQASSLAGRMPANATSLVIEGRSARGQVVARGAGVVNGDRACVCLARADEFDFFCKDITCEESADQCSFVNTETQQPDDTRTVVLGDDPSADLPADPDDTYLEQDSILSYGGSNMVHIASEPARVGLLRLSLAEIPASVEIEAARLLWPIEALDCAEVDTEGSCVVVAYRLVEQWDEGAATGEAQCPNWNCRREGVLWTVPGANALDANSRSRTLTPEAIVEVAPDAAVLTLPVDDAARLWHDMPDKNHGLIVYSPQGASLTLRASEADGSGPVLELDLRLEDSQPYVPDAGPPDASSTDAGPSEQTLLVPAGSFTMGCEAARNECGDLASPAHTVTLTKSFELDRTEVSQEAYAECVAAGSCVVPSCDYDPATRGPFPVVCVTWQEALEYCTYRGGRLPSEAEWERAARGDGNRDYPWGNEPSTCALANGVACGGVTRPVGMFADGAGPFGHLDLAGNVREWVSPGAGEYTSAAVEDPADPTTIDRRGGAFGSTDYWLLTFKRHRTDVSNMSTEARTGFRCAYDVE